MQEILEKENIIREEFINFLKVNGIDYTIDNEGYIIISYRYNINIHGKIEMPEKVIFENKGYVQYNIKDYIPNTVIFKNSGDVYLHNDFKFKKAYKGFQNGGNIYPENFSIKLPKIPINYSQDLRLFIDNEKTNTICNMLSRLSYSGDFKISFISFDYNKVDEATFLSYDRILKEYKKYKNIDANKKISLNDFLYLNSDNLFKLSYKNSIKVGRLIKGLLPKSTNSEIEEFVNLWKSHLSNSGYTMELVKGEDIRKYYCRDNQDTHEGSCLYNSCYNWKTLENTHSNGNNLYKQLEFYVKNPNIGLLILKEKGSDKIKARALTWFSNNGKVLIDYIFYTNPYDKYFYYKYATINDYFIVDRGGSYRGNILVDVPDEAATVEVIPRYLDILAYYPKEKIIK